MATAARFFAKVYTLAGTFRAPVIDESLLLGVPTIVREVNKPAGSIELNLAYPFDDFGYSTAIDVGNLVKVYAVNEANKTGLLVYQGFIEEIDGTFSASTNSVALRIFPIDALMERSLWKSGGSFVISYPAADVDTIFSDAIDAMNVIYGTFFSKNLGNPGLTINQTFTRQTHLAAMNAAAKSLVEGWYWRIRADGQVDLAQFNDVTPTHKLTVGKDIDTIHVVKSALNLKNKVVVSWGPTPTDTEYSDATSITNYGQRMALISDSGVNDLTTANTKGNAEIARQKNIITKTEIIVNTQYAIETILPGDTIKIENVTDNTSQMVTGVLRVLRTEYNGATCSIHLGDVLDNFGNELGLLLDQ